MADLFGVGKATAYLVTESVRNDVLQSIMCNVNENNSFSLCRSTMVR